MPAVSTMHGAAPPAHSNGGRGGAGPFGSSSSSGYAGYGSSSRVANAGTISTPSPASNPYQTSKSSSGATCQRLFLGLLALTSLALAGTTVRFRGILKARQADVANERRTLAAWEKEGPPRPRGRRASGQDPQGATKDAHEKARLERDVRELAREIAAHRAQHAEAAAAQKVQEDALAALVAKRQEASKALAHARNVLEDGTEEASKYAAMVDGLDAVEKYMAKREGALWGRIDGLQARIESDSHREATEWFGPGPHRVELDLEYPEVQRTNPDATTWPRSRGTITLEMAPLDVMPHAVNLFLQQVHHRLWNSCAVLSSADHIFQLAPSYRDEDLPGAVDRAGKKTHYEHFRAKGLDKVTYQEYSAGYPHEQWTVGLTGRPGGPDFYINKRNNTQIHGPGGQLNAHDLHNEADPCFGKVVKGQELLAEIGGVPTDPEQNYAFKYPVAILEARVLTSLEGPAEGWRAVKPGEKFDGGQIMPLPDVPHGS